MFFPLLFGVVHRLFDDGKVHQRFAAEKVHFEDFAVAAVRDKKIDGGFRHVEAHIFRPALITSLPRKTVFAAQVAVVANMQAKRLYEVAFQRDFPFLLGKKHPLFFQFGDFRFDLPDRLLVRTVKIVGFAVHLLHDFGRKFIADMQRAGSVVEKIVRSVGFKCMYHLFFSVT